MSSSVSKKKKKKKKIASRVHTLHVSDWAHKCMFCVIRVENSWFGGMFRGREQGGNVMVMYQLEEALPGPPRRLHAVLAQCCALAAMGTTTTRAFIASRDVGICSSRNSKAYVVLVLNSCITLTPLTSQSHSMNASLSRAATAASRTASPSF
jgi:hypothetical protein